MGWRNVVLAALATILGALLYACGPQIGAPTAAPAPAEEAVEEKTSVVPETAAPAETTTSITVWGYPENDFEEQALTAMLRAFAATSASRVQLWMFKAGMSSPTRSTIE